MTKRLFLVLILFAALLCPASAIGFGYHIIEAKAEADFSAGIFPVALNYQFNFPVPDVIEGSSTELAFRLDNGLDIRKLRQHPDDGRFLNDDNACFPLEYMVLYDEFNLFYRQGFWNDHISLGLYIDGRFENAYETFDYKYDAEHDEGLFWKKGTDGEGKETMVERFAGSSFTGAPELRGDRSIFNTSLSASFTLDFLDDEITRRNGMKFDSYFRISGPVWIPLNDGTSDYILSRNTLDLAFTFIDAPWKDGRSWFSVVLDNSTTYRCIMGEKVPYYIQGGEMWNGNYMPNTQHVLTSLFSLTFYGPQLSADTYPSLSVFMDLGLSYGKALNSSSDEVYRDFSAIFGFKAEFLILDIAKFYVQCGYVKFPSLNQVEGPQVSIGFTFGV